MKVLVVDDCPDSRRLIRLVLERLGGVEVVECTDGIQAIERLGAFAADLIIVDFDMPRMNGVTFVKTYRHQDRRTPIIMLTGVNEKAFVVEAIRVGINDYVIKPFVAAGLATRIRDVMERCGSGSRTGSGSKAA